MPDVADLPEVKNAVTVDERLPALGAARSSWEDDISAELGAPVRIPKIRYRSGPTFMEATPEPT